MTDRDEAIEKAQEVLQSWAAYTAGERSAATKAVVDLATEELIDFLLVKFEGSIDPNQVQAVFDGGRYRLDHDALEEVPEPMVPIAVMRELLYTHKVLFNHRNVTNWKAFVSRFGRFILGG